MKNPEYLVLGLVILGLFIGMTVAYKAIPPAPPVAPKGQEVAKPPESTVPAEAVFQQIAADIRALIDTEKVAHKHFCDQAQEMVKLMSLAQSKLEKVAENKKNQEMLPELKELKESIGTLNTRLLEKPYDWCQVPLTGAEARPSRP